MPKQLAMNTTVDGVTYKAGTVPPAKVAAKIDNPKSWGEKPDDKKPARPSGRGRGRGRGKSPATESTGDPKPTGDGDPTGDTDPKGDPQGDGDPEKPAGDGDDK